MKIEILVVLITAFFIANTYSDGKYLKIVKSWKKYYQMAGIGFVGLSAFLFMRKHPMQTKSLLCHANGILKYMPIDKEAGDFLTPILDMTKTNGLFSSMAGTGAGAAGTGAGMASTGAGAGMAGGMYVSPQEKRMLNSGRQNQGDPTTKTKRCVSETKKKYVAAQQGWNCGNCKKQLPAWFEVDHKIRLDNGGSNHVDNLVALCRDCHGQKTAFENL
jgi:hypothetical protein